MRRRIFALSLGALILAGCDVASTPPAISPLTSPSPAAAPTTNPTNPPATPTLSESGAITLTVWTTDLFVPGASPSGEVWRDQFAAFRAANPNIDLDLVLKKTDGKGSLLDSLLTTRNVVPALLPDVVIINASEVSPAAEKNILQPLDGNVSSELRANRFPFAEQFATHGNQWIAIPFAADVQQLIYNQAAVPTAPRAWDDITRQKTPILLPLGGDEGFLLQYFALADSVNDFDALAATQVLAFIKRAREQGLVSADALSAKNADDAWNAFVGGRTAMAQVRASRYLAERNTLSANLNAWFAPVPTGDGKIATIATAWAFAVVTRDAKRRQAAVSWIEWLTKPERLVPYLRAASLLPTTRGLIASTLEPKEYASFIREMLERATPMPSLAQNYKRAEAWRAGVAAVWRGQMTPEEAARSIAGAR